MKVAEELPGRIRTEFQIALNDLIDKRVEILEIVNAIDSVSTNLCATARLTHLATDGVQDSLKLTKDILPEGKALVDAVETAINASRELVREIDKLSVAKRSAGTICDQEERGFNINDYRATAETISEAAGEVQQLLVEIQALTEWNPQTNSEESTRSFDIRDYDATAQSIERGAAEVRRLLDDLQTLSEDDVAAQRTAAHFRIIIDHGVWRVVQVIVLIFLLLCLHTFLRARLFAGKREVSQDNEFDAK